MLPNLLHKVTAQTRLGERGRQIVCPDTYLGRYLRHSTLFPFTVLALATFSEYSPVSVKLSPHLCDTHFKQFRFALLQVRQSALPSLLTTNSTATASSSMSNPSLQTFEQADFIHTDPTAREPWLPRLVAQPRTPW
jgi:hypothetical protein